jgi:hypothetical protein
MATDAEINDFFGVSEPRAATGEVAEVQGTGFKVKERSPDIVVDCLDCAENVKDATSEKTELDEVWG